MVVLLFFTLNRSTTWPTLSFFSDIMGIPTVGQRSRVSAQYMISAHFIECRAFSKGFVRGSCNLLRRILEPEAAAPSIRPRLPKSPILLVRSRLRGNPRGAAFAAKN